MNVAITVLASTHQIDVENVTKTFEIVRPALNNLNSNNPVTEFPLAHPTLSNTLIEAVAGGWRFVVEGNTIMTLTKDGVEYG